jgi:non-specific serine/threonine protein kinase
MSLRLGLASSLLVLACAAPAHAAAWIDKAPLPEARAEVVSTVVNGKILVIGGVRGDGSASRRVDAYDPAGDDWSRLPNLPIALHHPAAAAWKGRVYVAGGYRHDGHRARALLVFRGGKWRFGPRLPAERAAAGAAVIGHTLVVAGGVGPNGLAQSALFYNLRTGRWRFGPGPTPREHLGVTAWAGKVYVVGGRTSGFASNLKRFERYLPKQQRWERLPPVPRPRGGTGAAALNGWIVSVGGEATTGTIRSVYRYNVAARRWTRLPDLPTPRHGLGVAAFGARVYALGGGVVPGLSVSTANESLGLPGPVVTPPPRAAAYEPH